jgi:hexosaminidase
MIMPRLTAMAERAWAGTPGGVAESDDAGWSRFVNTLGKRVLPRLDLEPANVQYRIAPPGLMVVDGRVMVNHEIPGLTLRYTSDGTEPNASSALVTGPIAQKGMIAVAAFDRLGRHGEVAHVENP